MDKRSSESPLEKLRPIIDKEIKDFSQVLEKDTSLVPILLKFHLLTENCLERIISSKLSKGYQLLDNSGFTYHHKLELVHALDVLPDNIIGSLRKLNQLRNECSHNRNLVIDSQMIESIGKPLGKEYIDIRNEHRGNLDSLLVFTFSRLYSNIITVVLLCEYKD
jgi:hypothetical protein